MNDVLGLTDDVLNLAVFAGRRLRLFHRRILALFYLAIFHFHCACLQRALMLQVEELVFLGCHALGANRQILLLSLLYLVQSIRRVAEDVEIGRLALGV